MSLGLFCISFAGVSATSLHAAALMVDFGTGGSPVETGYSQQSTNSVTHSTVLGNIDLVVTSAQGVFDRGASGGVNNDLYRDFYFTNNAADIVLTLSGAGIAANTDYILTFYSYDSNESRVTEFTAISGTIGPSLTPKVNDGVGGDVPDTLDEFASTGTYTSNGSGQLVIQLVGGRTVVNGLELDVVPEPSSVLLVGLSSLFLIRRARATS